MLLESIKNNQFQVITDIFNKVDGIIAKEEALEWGHFRTGKVSIAGTKIYQVPDFQALYSIFDSEIELVLNNFNPVEQAIRLFL